MKFKKGEQIKIFENTDVDAYVRLIRNAGYKYKVGSEYIKVGERNRLTLDRMKVGRMLRIARKKRGISREALSEAIGVLDKTMFEWERGYRVPCEMNLEKYCAYVGLKVKDVIKECQIEEG